MERLYTTHDVSRLLQVDPSSVSKWIDKGKINAYRTPGGHRRVREGDLRRFLTEHRIPVPEELDGGAFTLLAVDDEKPVLDGLRRSLKPYSSAVELLSTTSGIEALLMMSERRPSALLIDLNLPDLNGLEVCRRMRSREKLERVTVVTMTARHSPQADAQSREAGAVACISKPIDVEALLKLLQLPVQARQ